MQEVKDKTAEEVEYQDFIAHHQNGHYAHMLEYAMMKKEWEHETIVVKEESGNIIGAMLLLIRKMPGGRRSLVYCPRGPVCDRRDKETFHKLTQKAEEVAKKHHAFMITMNPDISNDDMDFKQMAKENGYKILEKVDNINEVLLPRVVFRLNHLQEQTEDELFASFHQKTRYNIRLATKKGVTIREGKREDLAEFHKLMEVTGSRDQFHIPPLSYFEEVYDLLGEDYIKIFFADYEGEAIACTFNIRFSNKVWYMYGGSSNEKRNLMPTYLLQWEGIKWAKESGCDIYDFRGICAVNKEEYNEGLYRFKQGFHPDLIEFTEIYKVYSPVVYFLFKKLLPWYRKIRVAMGKKRKA